jgi:hypothetical protein
VRILKFILIFVGFAFLTALTQIGGLIYLISFSTYNFINKNFNNKIIRSTLKFISFLMLYSIATFFIVPLVAKSFGRVALPLTQTENLRPLNFLTCFLNRNYVRLELKETTLEVARQMHNRYPGTVVNYLDANFPFINNFPLFPHLSHGDGKKLDIAFCYIDKKTGNATDDAPSVIGYGISEEPRGNELNTATLCAKRGYWQYNFMMKLIPQGNKSNFILTA